MDNPLRSLARLFVTPYDERPQPAKKFIAGTNIEYANEIKSSFTGKTIAYEQKNGTWVTVQQGRITGSGAIKTAEPDEELKAIQDLYGWKM